MLGLAWLVTDLTSLVTIVTYLATLMIRNLHPGLGRVAALCEGHAQVSASACPTFQSAVGCLVGPLHLCKSRRLPTLQQATLLQRNT